MTSCNVAGRYWGRIILTPCGPPTIWIRCCKKEEPGCTWIHHVFVLGGNTGCVTCGWNIYIHTYTVCILYNCKIIIYIYTLVYCNYIFILPFHGQCWEAQTRLFSKRHHKVMFKCFTPPEKKIKRCQFDVFALAFTGILQNVERKVDPA